MGLVACSIFCEWSFIRALSKLVQYTITLPTFDNSFKEFVEWPSNVAYPVQITGKDSNLGDTVTTSHIKLNICACNATETG